MQAENGNHSLKFYQINKCKLIFKSKNCDCASFHS